MESENSLKRKKLYRFLFYFLMVISILLILNISFNVFSRYAARKEYSELRSQKPYALKIPNIQNELREKYEEGVKIVELNDKNHTAMLNKLKAQNSDTIAWLEIPGTKINYPIMQSKDNVFYLRKNFNKKYSVSGSIFADYRNNPNFNDQNTVIYGHNMKDGSMFYDVTLLKSQDFFNKYHKIYVTLDNKLLEYEIFSVYETKKDYNYRAPKYDELYFESRLNEFKRKSIIKNSIEVNTSSKLLTLSTCSYSFYDARFVVHAVLTSVVEYQ